jgi:hypothetical protein
MSDEELNHALQLSQKVVRDQIKLIDEASERATPSSPRPRRSCAM